MIRLCRFKDSTAKRTETPGPAFCPGRDRLTSNGSPYRVAPLNFFFSLPVPACRGLFNRTPATEPIEAFAVVSRNPACRSHRFDKTRRLRETWVYDCFITLRYDPPLWLVTVVTQTAIFFSCLFVISRGLLSVREHLSRSIWVLADIYHSILHSWNFLPSQYSSFFVDISRGCV